MTRLERQARTPDDDRPVLSRHGAGAIAALIGLASLAVAAWLQFGGDRPLSDVPDVRITVPPLVAAVAAAIASVVRRERPYALAIIGVACAACALALGWVIVVGIVVAGAVLCGIILHQVL